MNLDTFTHEGRAYDIVRDTHGKATAMRPRDGLLYSPDECAAALAAYLADAGDFASVRAAITDAARRERVTETTVTTWRAPLVRTNVRAAHAAARGDKCPSCDAGIDDAVCANCGAVLP